MIAIAFRWLSMNLAMHVAAVQYMHVLRQEYIIKREVVSFPDPNSHAGKKDFEPFLGFQHVM